MEKKEKKTVKAPESPMLTKIATLNSFASACENPELIEAFSNLKQGDKLLEVFVKAVEQEITVIMTGKHKEIEHQVNDVRATLASTYEMTNTLLNMLLTIGNSPVMKVLAVVHDKMTGTSFEEFIERTTLQANQQLAQRNAPRPQAPEEGEEVDQNAPPPKRPDLKMNENGEVERPRRPLAKRYAGGSNQVVNEGLPAKAKLINGL